MASTAGADDSYPTPTSILSKVGRTPSKHWGSKATDAVRFASFIESAPGNFTFYSNQKTRYVISEKYIYMDIYVEILK